MTRVVISGTQYGFEVSDEFIRQYGTWTKIPRHDPMLVTWVESLGTDTHLMIVEIVGDRYWIEDCYGMEYVWTPDSIVWTVAS